jgi:hypothetical protein
MVAGGAEVAAAGGGAVVAAGVRKLAAAGGRTDVAAGAGVPPEERGGARLAGGAPALVGFVIAGTGAAAAIALCGSLKLGELELAVVGALAGASLAGVATTAARRDAAAPRPPWLPPWLVGFVLSGFVGGLAVGLASLPVGVAVLLGAAGCVGLVPARGAGRAVCWFGAPVLAVVAVAVAWRVSGGVGAGDL